MLVGAANMSPSISTESSECLEVSEWGLPVDPSHSSIRRRPASGEYFEHIFGDNSASLVSKNAMELSGKL